jgi:hypothetical protein
MEQAISAERMLSGVVQEFVLRKLTPLQSPRAFDFSQSEKPMAAFRVLRVAGSGALV